MRAGLMDRRIVIQSATTAQDAAGQPIETWATFLEAWARRKDVRGAERHVAQQELATRTAVYELYWRAGVNETMRIVDAGVTYEIKGIAEDYRRGWLELSCEALNPADTQ